MTEELDTGEVAEVPEDQQLDTDEGEGTDAADGPDVDDDFSDLYEDPGAVVEEDLG